MTPTSRFAGTVIAAFCLLHFLILRVAASKPQAPDTIAGAVVTSTISDELISKTWDYIIVGAGPAGLTIARRLTEGTDGAHVLLIEAGNDTRKDPKVVQVTEEYGPIFDDPGLNWQYESMPQPFTQDHEMRSHIAGIGLGGSTSINGALFDEPDVNEIEAWKKFGNQGWSGQTVFYHTRKMQDYHAPQGRAKDFGASATGDAHDKQGPVAISYVGAIYAPAHQSVKKAVQDVFAVDQVQDTGVGGKANGFQFNPHYIVPDESSKTNKNVTSNLERVSAANGYLSPMENKGASTPRLTVLIGTRATRLMLESSKDGGVRAKGVYAQQSENGVENLLKASKEVVVSAGVFKSPILLELSGIGDSSVLQKLGVEQVLDLRGVGTNFMDTVAADLFAPIKLSALSLQDKGPTPAFAMLSVDKIFSNTTAMQSYINANLKAWAKRNVELGGMATMAGAERQLQVQSDGIFQSQWPVAELQFFARKGADSLRVSVNMMQPFTRGSVHASSKSATWSADAVNISSSFFAQSIDLDFHVASLRSGRKLLRADAMKEILTGNETQPGFDYQPKGKDDPPGVPDDANLGAYDDWVRYLEASYFPYSHALGTCSMMSKELGGVVGPDFRVHGTTNLRVVDASVIPMQFTGHPTGTIYGLAELASQLILARKGTM